MFDAISQPELSTMVGFWAGIVVGMVLGPALLAGLRRARRGSEWLYVAKRPTPARRTRKPLGLMSWEARN